MLITCRLATTSSSDVLPPHEVPMLLLVGLDLLRTITCYVRVLPKDHLQTCVSPCLGLARMVVFSSRADADGSVSNIGPVSLLHTRVYYFKAIRQFL